ncbi:hypothetical protein TNCV_911501 [Trichonephila clavipes]|nr:hypothetical protein TNCV_911501 [Trichonephila clavipes]
MRRVPLTDIVLTAPTPFKLAIFLVFQPSLPQLVHRKCYGEGVSCDWTYRPTYPSRSNHPAPHKICPLEQPR